MNFVEHLDEYTYEHAMDRKILVTNKQEFFELAARDDSPYDAVILEKDDDFKQELKSRIEHLDLSNIVLNPLHDSVIFDVYERETPSLKYRGFAEILKKDHFLNDIFKDTLKKHHELTQSRIIIGSLIGNDFLDVHKDGRSTIHITFTGAQGLILVNNDTKQEIDVGVGNFVFFKNTRYHKSPEQQVGIDRLSLAVLRL